MFVSESIVFFKKGGDECLQYHSNATVNYFLSFVPRLRGGAFPPYSHYHRRLVIHESPYVVFVLRRRGFPVALRVVCPHLTLGQWRRLRFPWGSS